MTMQRLFFTSTNPLNCSRWSAPFSSLLDDMGNKTRTSTPWQLQRVDCPERKAAQVHAPLILPSYNVLQGFSDLPPELGLRVVDHLPYADRCRFAQTSNYAAALAAETLQSAAAKLLASFSLLYEDVKMMQTATGAAFYGLAVDALLRTTEDCLEVTRLELVVPKACGR
ncbi:hypothetical protein R3P38DRAFT_3246531 [Favolaschia claudopus]|uniref:F-box domain-containing protein n=1 Tax=Favolaschia claudopus TaxID=2862362 RepID=A0AAV9YYP4_9AGAR